MIPPFRGHFDQQVVHATLSSQMIQPVELAGQARNVDFTAQRGLREADRNLTHHVLADSTGSAQ